MPARKAKEKYKLLATNPAATVRLIRTLKIFSFWEFQDQTSRGRPLPNAKTPLEELNL